MESVCEFTTQGIYACRNKEKKPQTPVCDDDTTILKYSAADVHYDMNMRAMLYQLRATEAGYKMFSLQEKKKSQS